MGIQHALSKKVFGDSACVKQEGKILLCAIPGSSPSWEEIYVLCRPNLHTSDPCMASSHLWLYVLVQTAGMCMYNKH